LTIAITGATGHLGRLVIDELLSRTEPATIVALARDTAKATDMSTRGVQVRPFDYDRPDTLAPALDGVDRLLLISGSAVGQRVPQHAAVIDAATTAGVPFVAYTSVLHADAATHLAVAPEHVETEALLAEAPFTVALLRNGWYSENLVDTAKQAADSGVLLTSADDGKQFTASRADFAAAAAAVLTAPTAPAATYELAGDTGFSYEQFAEMVSELTGKPVTVNHVSSQEHRAALADAGLPDGLVDFLVSTDQAIADGELADTEPGTLSSLIGRPTTPMGETLAKVAVNRV